MSIVLNEFLALLEANIAAHPESVLPLSPELAGRIAALTEDIPTFLSDEIEGLVAL